MDINQIRGLALRLNATQAAKEAGIPLRTFMRFRAGAWPTEQTLYKLNQWVFERVSDQPTRHERKKVKT